MCVGHDDLYKKKPRYNPHAHDPMARTWANDFNNLALDARYEKTAAPFSKRRNSTYQPVDRNRGGFYGLGGIDSQQESSVLESAGRTIQDFVQSIPPAAIGATLAGIAVYLFLSGQMKK